MASNNNNNNSLEVPQARSLMEHLKNEVAEELGIFNYDQLDKGDLPARLHGKIGGNMVKKMIEFAENAMVDQNGVIQVIEKQQGPTDEDKQDVQRYIQQYNSTHTDQVIQDQSVIQQQPVEQTELQ